MTRIQDEIGPIRALVRAPHEEPPFASFLAALGERVRGAAMLAVRGSDGRLQALPATAPDGAARRFVGDELPRRDRFPRRRLRDGRVYAADELLDPLDPADRDWRGALGETRLRVVRADLAGGGAVFLAILRETRDFGGADSALLSDLALLVAEAADAMAAVAASRLCGAAGGLALARLGLRWTALDRDAEALAGAPLAPVRGLREAIADGAAALLPSASPGSPLLLHPSDSANVAIVFHGPPRESAKDPVSLARAFGLSPAEGRFAALLGAGLPIVEAGRRLGLSAETARHYSKRVYQKTGVCGHAEWVARCHAGVFALLQEPRDDLAVGAGDLDRGA